MLESMTGYGKVDVQIEKLSCTAEARSVNHKFLEVRIKLPKEYQSFEESLKAIVRKKLRRGKVDIQLNCLESENNTSELIVDEEILSNTAKVLNTIEEKLDRKVSLNFNDLFGVQGLLKYETEKIDIKKIEELFISATSQVCDSLQTMRKREGELLQEKIKEMLVICQEKIDQVPLHSDEVIQVQKNRLQKNLEALSAKYKEDDPRILQEISFFMDRCDISEEITRFNAHIIHFHELLEKNEPVGRKLDFLLQELNRETNTLCSKANHTKLAKLGVDLKCEIEKIREQVQNVE
ncbi:MAG: hypothetical protein ACI86H_000233 [bacterium]|jgi:uncharacterized protein (TIGR00255 family)